jgi:alkylhydroperoxidase family enzyme
VVGRSIAEDTGELRTVSLDGVLIQETLHGCAIKQWPCLRQRSVHGWTMLSPAEKAALAYCESLTLFHDQQFPALHDALRAHFTEREVAEIAAVIINMTVWTRLKLAQGAIPEIQV